MKSEQLPNSNNQVQLKNQITLVKRTKNKEEEINEPTHSKVTRFGTKVPISTTKTQEGLC